MKVLSRILTVFVALGIMFVLSGVIPTQKAQAYDPPKNASEFCVMVHDLGFDTHGECVSLVAVCTNNGNTDPVCFCKGIKPLLNFFGIPLGQCISEFRN